MSLTDLRGASSQDLAGGADGMVGLEPVRSVSSADPLGLGLEVLIAEWSSGGEPKSTSLRKLHSNRVGKKIYPLVVAADRFTFEMVWLFGPNPDAQPTGPLSTDRAVRMAAGRLERAKWARSPAATLALSAIARDDADPWYRQLRTVCVPLPHFSYGCQRRRFVGARC